MKRPDIEELKNYVKNCCGIPPDRKGFCESYGCSSILPLIEYIEFLEQNHLTSAMHADGDTGAVCKLCGYSHPGINCCDYQ